MNRACERLAARCDTPKLITFEYDRAENRKIAENDISKAIYELLEFDRYVQAPNDGYAISVRLDICFRHVFDRKVDDELDT